MTLKTYEFTTDLIIDIEPTQNIRFYQNDHNSAHLVFFVTDRKQPVNLTNAKVKIVLQKPDGTIVFQDDCTPIDAATGKFEVILNTQTLVVDGTAYGQIHIEDGDKILECRKFELYIDRSILSQDAIESTNEFLALQKAIQAGEKLEGINIDEIVAAGNVAQEVVRARIGETGVVYHTLKERIDSDSLKMSIVTPEEFGAKGDDQTDDFNAIKKCIDSGATTIKFGKNKTYIVSTFGFHSEVNNLTIDGNGSTIKLMDNSGLLTRVFNNQESYYENYCFYLGGNNNTVKNLTIDANADNNFFTFNGGIYYGYQKDIGIPGLPQKYITTFGVECYGNNFKVENCHFKDLGGAVRFNGKTFLGFEKVENCLVSKCTFKNGFRDQVSVFHARNIKVEKCDFYDNQRKAIQLYLDIKNAEVIENNISINISNVRKWYPTWSVNQPDAELSGIAVKNPGYPEIKYVVEKVAIKKNRLYDLSNGVLIRDYSKDIDIDDNYFENCSTAIQTTTGLDGIINVKKNRSKNCSDIVMLTLSKNANMDTSFTKNVICTVNVESNLVNVKGSLVKIDPKGNLDLYRDLTIRVLNNDCMDDSIPIRYSNSINNIPFLTLIQRGNKTNNRAIKVNRYGSVVTVPSFENFSFKTNTVGSKTSTGYDFVKLFSLRSSTASSNCFLTGSIYNISGSNIHFCNFYVSIRIHFNGIENNSIIQAGVKNVIGSRPVNSIQFVDRAEGNERVIDVYGYVNNESGQSVFEFNSPNGVTENFTFVESDSNAWVNSLGNGTVVVSGQI
ncbi:BppU family phage baseplate upper protein [Bacillus cereus]|nr:BppU family phage baseplate upper protein [Bacillus cereus]MDA2722292.1 BppU family phage baseplate upper protein [Bacillus cereus]MDA2727941.1 BppU family phage baseplate upper protein [Bacillus cereus]